MTTLDELILFLYEARENAGKDVSVRVTVPGKTFPDDHAIVPGLDMATHHGVLHVHVEEGAASNGDPIVLLRCDERVMAEEVVAEELWTSHHNRTIH
ncbi:MAG: hypothetical protein GDA52_08980 [Rhodobacteraceae bacterium]|nr:hypothetical protein [Paracoccaceae bacterium]